MLPPGGGRELRWPELGPLVQPHKRARDAAPPRRPIQGLGLARTNLGHGDAGGSPSPRRGQEHRGKQGAISRGVEGRNTKIRASVPKKTLAPTKALERGSSARNVTPGSTPAGLGNEVSLQGHGHRPVAGGQGTSPLASPARKAQQRLPATSQPRQACAKARGQPPLPGAD